MSYHDDISSISASGCNIVYDSDTIINRNNNTYTIYRNIGGTWLKTREYTSQYSNYSDYLCVDVDTLNSSGYYVPFYELIALLGGIAFIVFFYKLLIKPFLRSRLC